MCPCKIPFPLLRTFLGLILLFGTVLLSVATGQGKQPELPHPRPVLSDKERTPPGPDILPPSSVQGLSPAIPVILGDVLKLASIANLDIVQANLVVERARANLLQAKSRYLPNLDVGSTYAAHEGTIQRTEGTIIDVNRDSLFVGGGPVFVLGISEAIYLLPQANSRLNAALSGQVRVTNDTLLQVANAYFNVLRARRQLARLDETLDFLTSERESELRGQSKGLLPLIKAFVKSGTALPSDQARVEADVVRRMSERSRAAQDVRTASAELARLLHLSAQLFLLPAEDYRWPLEIPGGMWFDQPIEVLVLQALRSRPELAENSALLQEAYYRYREAQWRPCLPILATGFSFGGFGGGPQVIGRTPSGSAILGPSGVIKDFDTRNDLDVRLIWRLQGLGVGNTAQIWDARVRLEQRQVQQLFLQDLVVRDVVQALEQIQRAAERVAVCRASLFDENRQPTGAVYRSLKLNFVRIRGGQGLPLEVLDSTRRLSDVLSEYANALTDFDQARYRLLVALGLPPAALIDPKYMPFPPNCPPGRETPQAELPPPNVNLPVSRPVDRNAETRNNRTMEKRAIVPIPGEPSGVKSSRKTEGTSPSGSAVPSPVRTPAPASRPSELPDDGLHFLPSGSSSPTPNRQG